MTGKVEFLIDAKAVLGEGPCWDASKGILYWVDIEGKKLHVFNPDTGEDREIEVGEMIGAVVPREAGGTVVVLESGFYFLDPEDGSLEQINDPESDLADNRFNDGKCDPAGRFWAGTLNKNGDEKQASLYCLETDMSVTRKLGNLSISNGLAWSPDNQFMYLIDTPTRQVTRYQYKLENGEISEPEVIIEIPDGEGFPDGMTIDEDGNLWIAHWGGGKVTNWDPITGELLQSIELPAVNVTSCTFGGDGLQDLYITTARNGMSEAELEEYPRAGGLFKIRTDTKGLPAYKFKG
ncbi:SMP-30/gluconolactonase/LRE family protein [Neobacillus notoginsengisoli]|uniref:Regucalcin n=1 Tax=Neobacillus notoginsengisoli TaxID=1578198 RepID=A0A417YS07_9BACI|nr:SMP-30/gluconolactonase/LRE family protein [Neobacillus notoginsengisoli]RHW38084.1 SMP-30/gluconolactonase/LRE family protein [Neobacillus notoginsengisoli]